MGGRGWGATQQRTHMKQIKINYLKINKTKKIGHILFCFVTFCFESRAIPSDRQNIERLVGAGIVKEGFMGKINLLKRHESKNKCEAYRTERGKHRDSSVCWAELENKSWWAQSSSGHLAGYNPDLDNWFKEARTRSPSLSPLLPFLFSVVLNYYIS